MNPGRLHLRVIWDGTRVTGVDISNSRPDAARLLQGRTPGEARGLVPLLFGICRHGQGAAAEGALSAAEGRHASLDGSAASAERAREHLWHLLLEWPRALGYEPDRDAYSVWHGRLGTIAERGAWGPIGADFKRFCEERLLDMDTAAWLRSDGRSGLGARYREQLSSLEGRTAMPFGTALLPARLDARHYFEGLSQTLNSESARHPTWQALPAETGTYARWHRLPPIAASGARIAARLNARLADLAAIAQEVAGDRPPGPACSSHSPEPGTGFAVVETARGLLMHWVRLERERIADYLILAPTEWNFHPAGAFRAGLVGLEAADPESIERYGRLVALALDPCVPCSVDVCRS